MELLLDRLTKQYGSKIAVDCVSATLKPGVYGLLGANGAGKTTLMRMLCAILESTSGEVLYWDICHRILDIIPIIQQWNF